MKTNDLKKVRDIRGKHCYPILWPGLILVYKQTTCLKEWHLNHFTHNMTALKIQTDGLLMLQGFKPRAA